MDDFWDSYTDKNQNKDAKGIADFIYHVCVTLDSKTVIEMGCNIGNNLQSFPEDFHVLGMDINTHAVEMAKQKYPQFGFLNGSVLDPKLLDNSFDVVFTRGVMIHLTKLEVEQAIREMIRISHKYIFHLEYFGKDEESVPYEVGLWKRNMKEYYKYLPVTIISDCEIPVEIDKDKVHFTLVKIK